MGLGMTNPFVSSAVPWYNGIVHRIPGIWKPIYESEVMRYDPFTEQ